LRRSTTSPIAPERSPASTIGRELAVCTSATRVAEEVKEVISQAAATLCIQVPTLEAKAAIHSALKRGTRSGAHAEEDAAACPSVKRDP
jgi:sugar-specific transcriptional regulator TrmB